MEIYKNQLEGLYRRLNEHFMYKSKKNRTCSIKQQIHGSTVSTCSSITKVLVWARWIIHCTSNKHWVFIGGNPRYGRFDYICKQCNLIEMVQTRAQGRIENGWSCIIILLPKNDIWNIKTRTFIVNPYSGPLQLKFIIVREFREN